MFHRRKNRRFLPLYGASPSVTRPLCWSTFRRTHPRKYSYVLPLCAAMRGPTAPSRSRLCNALNLPTRAREQAVFWKFRQAHFP